MLINWKDSEKSCTDDKCLEDKSHEDKLEETGLFSPEERLKGDLLRVFEYVEERQAEEEGLFSRYPLRTGHKETGLSVAQRTLNLASPTAMAFYSMALGKSPCQTQFPICKMRTAMILL